MRLLCCCPSLQQQLTATVQTGWHNTAANLTTPMCTVEPTTVSPTNSYKSGALSSNPLALPGHSVVFYPGPTRPECTTCQPAGLQG